jgi:DHA1 family tetracycline resistance protein-like MFS transporter
VGPLLHVRFFFGLAFSMFQSIFALYAAGKPLTLTPEATGFVLTYVGVLAVLIQGFGIGKLTQRYRETSLMLFAAVLLAVSLPVWGLTPNLITLLIVLAPLSLGGGILNTVVNSVLSKSVYPEEVGGTLGLAASVESSTRVIAPTIGGYLLGQFGALAPGLFTGLVMAWVAWIIWRRLIANPDPPLAPRATDGGPSTIAAQAQ